MDDLHKFTMTLVSLLEQNSKLIEDQVANVADYRKFVLIIGEIGEKLNDDNFDVRNIDRDFLMLIFTAGAQYIIQHCLDNSLIEE